MKRLNVVTTKNKAINSLKKTLFVAAFALATTGAFAQDFNDDVNDEVPATPIGNAHLALGAAMLLGGYFCFKGKFTNNKA